jgi:predicted aldo/keto reductase-like oxidoreductase
MSDAISRRRLLEVAGMASAAALMAPACSSSEPPPANDPAPAAGPPAEPPPSPLETLPTRTLGRSGLEVPILCYGAIDLQPGSKILLRRALELGIELWDTAAKYGGGASERAIGAYLAAFPEDRQRLLLLTKSTGRSAEALEKDLTQSLERMGIQHVDILLLHGVDDGEEFTDEIRAWAEGAKASGRVRVFGFSSHKNMASVIERAAATPWLECGMVTCSYRHLQEPEMQRALQAARAASLGLIAMKTQGKRGLESDPAEEQRLLTRFLERGLTPGQAKLKAIWDEPVFATITSKMTNVSLIEENLAAARDPRVFGAVDRCILQEHDRATAAASCTSCGACASALPGAEIMRALMYARAYGDPTRAKALLRSVMPALDPARVQAAEAACPRGVPLGRALADARSLFDDERDLWPTASSC